MKYFIAGNWKMNTDRREAVDLAAAIVDTCASHTDVDIAVCPPFVSLDAVFGVVHGTGIGLGGQNINQEDSGAFTGEISASMLLSVGCKYVIIGHSERRQYYGETDASVNTKVRQAMTHGIVPIICVGENLDQRDAGEEAQVVSRQVNAALDGIAVQSGTDLVIAYEPVWAIGTGRTASPAQAQEVHHLIRGLLSEKYGDLSNEIRVLYGGSMKPANAAELLAQPDVNGGLIGGASLKADQFGAIVAAASALND